MNNNIYKIIVAIFFSLNIFATPTGDAPNSDGYANDNQVVSFVDKNNVVESNRILKGATKNHQINSSPTIRTDIDPLEFAKVERLYVTDNYIEWRVIFNNSHASWDRPNMSIMLSNNLHVIDGTMTWRETYAPGETDRSIRVTQDPKKFTDFKAYVADWGKSLAHYLPNGLSNYDSQVGNGLFMLDYTRGNRDYSNFNKYGRSVGDIYYFKDYRGTLWFTKNRLEVTFRTNPIDKSRISEGQQEDYFVAAVLKSRQNMNDYTAGSMNVTTLKKSNVKDKYLQVRNNFYGFRNDEDENIEMHLRLRDEIKYYTFKYKNINKGNSKFAKNFIINVESLSSQNFEFRTKSNYIVRKSNVQNSNNAYIMDVSYYNLGDYTNLNDAQKNKFLSELRNIAEGSLEDKNTLFETRRDEAINTEKLMSLLSEEVNKERIKNTGRYINATEDKKNEYDQKLIEAKNLLNKSSGKALGATETENLYNALKSSREALNGVDEISKTRETVKNSIEDLKNLNDAQKRSLETEIEVANSDDEVQNIFEKAKQLDDKMKELKNKVKDIDYIKDTYEYEKNNTGLNSKIDEYYKEAKKLIEKDGQNQNKEYVEELIIKLNEVYEKLKNTSLAKYDNLVKSFYDVDTSIADNFDRSLYLNGDFGMSILNIFNKISNNSKLDKSDFPTNVQLGFNINYDENTKVGSFLEYKNKGNANVFGIGINGKMDIKNHNLLSFIRYRLIVNNKLYNNNLDVYLRYYYNFNLGNFTISPKIGTFVTYSSKLKLDEDVYMDERITAIFDNTNRFAYNFNNIGASLYLDTIFKIGINTNQKIYRESNLENNREIKNNLFEIMGSLGYEQKIKDFSIDTNFSLDHRLNTRFKIGGSYNKAW